MAVSLVTFMSQLKRGWRAQTRVSRKTAPWIVVTSSKRRRTRRAPEPNTAVQRGRAIAGVVPNRADHPAMQAVNADMTATKGQPSDFRKGENLEGRVSPRPSCNCSSATSADNSHHFSKSIESPAGSVASSLCSAARSKSWVSGVA